MKGDRAPFLTTQTLSRSRAAVSGSTKTLSRVGPVTAISTKVPGAGSVFGGVSFAKFRKIDPRRVRGATTEETRTTLPP